jgi:hypothetical protein
MPRTPAPSELTAPRFSMRPTPSTRNASSDTHRYRRRYPRPRGSTNPNAGYSYVMRPLRYSINVTLDGCCDHRVMVADEDLHRHAVENLERADALLFGRVTYEMMEAAWRPPTRTGERPDWMEPFARTIDAAKKYVVSEHPKPGRLERGAPARGPGEGRSAAQAGVGQGTVRGRGTAPSCVGGAGIDR